jgi:redox-sensitive bicupin YhaK (pirin superfamily)
MEVLYRDRIDRNRFNGVREHRLVFDDRVAAGRETGSAWQGLGNFVYLADARFVPLGETAMHTHRNLDVISVVLDGKLLHRGTLDDGLSLADHQVLVQRAGDQGFAHNEINPDERENRMLQLWVLPEQAGGTAEHRCFSPEQGRVTRVYGGPAQTPSGPFAAATCVDVAWLHAGQSMDIDKPALVYVAEGAGFANEDSVSEGVLLRGEGMTFDATEAACLILVHQESSA